MPAIGRILLHAIAAAAIFFLFQLYVLTSSIQTSAIWAIAGALGAAWIAWSQERRGN